MAAAKMRCGMIARSSSIDAYAGGLVWGGAASDARGSGRPRGQPVHALDSTGKPDAKRPSPPPCHCRLQAEEVRKMSLVTKADNEARILAHKEALERQKRLDAEMMAAGIRWAGRRAGIRAEMCQV